MASVADRAGIDEEDDDDDDDDDDSSIPMLRTDSEDEQPAAPAPPAAPASPTALRPPAPGTAGLATVTPAHYLNGGVPAELPESGGAATTDAAPSSAPAIEEALVVAETSPAMGAAEVAALLEENARCADVPRGIPRAPCHAKEQRSNPPPTMCNGWHLPRCFRSGPTIRSPTRRRLTAPPSGCERTWQSGVCAVRRRRPVAREPVHARLRAHRGRATEGSGPPGQAASGRGGDRAADGR